MQSVHLLLNPYKTSHRAAVPFGSYSQISTTYIYACFFKIWIYALFPEKLMKMSKSHNVKESEKKSPGFIHLSGSSPKVNGVYSGLRPIIHPSFLKIQSVGFL